MNFGNYTNEELIRHVDNSPNATELERELATRLDELAVEIKLLTPVEQRGCVLPFLGD